MNNKIKFNRPLNAEQSHLLKNMKGEINSDRTSAVSFEMFETLVLRPFFDRQDIALLMEDDFSSVYIGKKSFYELRTEAEKRMLKKNSDTGCVKLEEIYSCLEKISKISPSSREKLMNRECELEEYFCYPRRCGMELYKKAREKGMKVIITADTFLPRKTVEKILKNCGYGDWDKLYITGELNIPKAPDGQLFTKICKDLKLPAHRLLHFGGDLSADAEAPIKAGTRSVLVTSCRDRLIKSGQLCGYIQKKIFFDFCSQKYLSLRCILALYSHYAFDYPQKRIALSDFCGDRYMAGFLILGALSLDKSRRKFDKLKKAILTAMEETPEITAGKEDFSAVFSSHFGSHLDKYGYAGCELPFEFYTEHGAVEDRMFIQDKLSSDVVSKWAVEVSEPETAPVYVGEVKQSAMSKLADKMFPPGTQVRIYAEGVLAKLHKKKL